eukprot:7390887-Prymnesium_polylepis.1
MAVKALLRIKLVITPMPKTLPSAVVQGGSGQTSVIRRRSYEETATFVHSCHTICEDAATLAARLP